MYDSTFNGQLDLSVYAYSYRVGMFSSYGDNKHMHALMTHEYHSFVLKLIEMNINGTCE